MRENTLMAQRFDTGRLELQGDPYPVAEQVGANIGSGNSKGGMATCENGVLAYRVGGVTGANRLMV